MKIATRPTSFPRRRRLAASGVLLYGLALMSACGRTSETADEPSGRLPIPDGTAVRTHSAVVDLDGRDRLPIVQEQVYRTEDGWLDGGGDTLHLAAAGDRLLVLSGDFRQIAQFSADGSLTAYWSSHGNAAGQLFGPIGMAVVGDLVHVADVAAMRLSRWTTDGEYVDELSHEQLLQITGLGGASPAGLVVTKALLTQNDLQQSLSLLSFDGDEVGRYAVLPEDRNQAERTLWPRPAFAVAPGGAVYASTGSEYQVNAFAPAGDLNWVASVDWPREPVSDEDRRTIERTQRAGRALGANVRDQEQVPAPDSLPALEGLEVDGRGRLYVFPLVAGPSDRYPVDVYSAEGDRLTTGWLPFQGWSAASGDRIYRIESDPDTGATVVVRYRFAIPAN
jgi:hypothetical protein